jgi:hypothetical protein
MFVPLKIIGFRPCEMRERPWQHQVGEGLDSSGASLRAGQKDFKALRLT